MSAEFDPAIQSRFEKIFDGSFGGFLETAKEVEALSQDLNTSETPENYQEQFERAVEVVASLARANYKKEKLKIETPLMHAVCFNKLDECQALINSGCSLNDEYEEEDEEEDYEYTYTSYTALSLAMQKGHMDIARLLITSGANVNCEYCGPRSSYGMPEEQGVSPLYYAIHAEDVDMVKLILSAGVNLKKPLHSVISHERVLPVGLAVEFYFESREYSSDFRRIIKPGRKEPLEIVKLLINAGGYHSSEIFGCESIYEYIFDADYCDEELLKAAGLKNIYDQYYRSLEHEIEIRTLLAVTDKNYKKPEKYDFRQVYMLLQDRMPKAMIEEVFNINREIISNWHHGKEDIPYSTWRLMCKVALNEHGLRHLD